MAAMLIARLGWRAAYVVLGLVVCGIGVPACLRVRYETDEGKSHHRENNPDVLHTHYFS